VHALQVSVLRPAMAYRALALAYLRVNRLSDVKRVIAEAQADGKDATNLHYILYEVAVIERDPASLKREEEWAVGKPEYYSMLQAETVRAADEGRINESESLIAEALKAGNPDFADGTVIDEANFELTLGRTGKARELLHRAKDKQDPDYITAAIRCGDLAAGEAFIRQHEADTQNTILHFVILPRVRTLLALRQKKLPAAVAAIKPALAYPLSYHEVLGLAGDVYLASGDAESAIHYYRERIAHPGLEDPMFPLTVVAHLGLARAYAMEHKNADSRSEYEDFCARWKDADRGLPILEQARREYAQLPSGR
jgi:tetratricopeptide (TPR) repeat protein